MGLEALAKPVISTWYNHQKDCQTYRIDVANVWVETHVSKETLFKQDKEYLRKIFHMKFYELEEKFPNVRKLIDDIFDYESKGEQNPHLKYKSAIPDPAAKKKKYKFSAGGVVSGSGYIGELPEVAMLPGLMTKVRHPVYTTEQWAVRDAIINLNDVHTWTREQIADWLDTLDVDLRFKTPEDKQLTLEDK
jgi:hypothetical protein